MQNDCPELCRRKQTGDRAVVVLFVVGKADEIAYRVDRYKQDLANMKWNDKYHYAGNC